VPLKQTKKSLDVPHERREIRKTKSDGRLAAPFAPHTGGGKGIAATCVARIKTKSI
jgi:hypothetical protein